MAEKLLDIAQFCLETAQKMGADEADAVVFAETDLSLRTRMKKLETAERAESTGVGVRLLIADKTGYRQALISSTDLSKDGLKDSIEAGIAMAKGSPSDPYIAIAKEEQLATNFPDLDLKDSTPQTTETMLARAQEIEAQALSHKGITNSEGAEVSYSEATTVLAISNGFNGVYSGTTSSASVSVIAGTDLAMETDYAYSVARHANDLKTAKEIGDEASERALARLSPKKQKTCQVPVIFDKRVARGLLSSFIGAINGAAIARGTSFLGEAMNTQVFADSIQIFDDPLMPRGLASELFDAEGVAVEKRQLIENGVLQTWILDLRSANQLGLETTGHASRGLSSAPSPASSNVYMQNGTVSLDDLIGDIKNGFYVTDAFGMGVNGVTGDYSQGAAGIWIENGKLTFPVAEMTIASNLKDMFLGLTPADDLEFTSSKNCPSLRVENMTVAGV